jgi:hypothetical protein
VPLPITTATGATAVLLIVEDSPGDLAALPPRNAHTDR